MVNVVEIGPGINLSPEAKSVNEYIRRLSDDAEKAENFGDKTFITTIAFHCYGLAEAIERDQAAANKSAATQLRALAGKYVPLEQFAEIKSRRIDPRGRIKIAAEELSR